MMNQHLDNETLLLTETEKNTTSKSIASSSNNKANDKLSASKKYFFDDDKFQQLRDLQQRIYDLNSFTPSISKLVNLLITEENLCTLEKQMSNYFTAIK